MPVSARRRDSSAASFGHFPARTRSSALVTPTSREMIEFAWIQPGKLGGRPRIHPTRPPTGETADDGHDWIENIGRHG
jgi:hypothetical protein